MEYYDLLPIIERLDRIEKKMDKKLSDKWMNTKEVAIYTTLSIQTIHRGIRKGELKVAKGVQAKTCLNASGWTDGFRIGNTARLIRKNHPISYIYRVPFNGTRPTYL